MNNLKGEIPKEIGKLINLQELFLYNNQLLRRNTKRNWKLINLKKLHLSTNNLSGEIPKEIGKLINLQIIFKQ